MISAVVTTHGTNPTKLQKTLESIRRLSKVTQVVVTATGQTPASVKKLKPLLNLRGKPTRLILNSHDYSNLAWINGVAAATEKLTILIHDGDVLSERLDQAEFRSSCANIYQAYNLAKQPWVHNTLCVPGFDTKHEDVARVTDRYGTKTVSPGQCAWPTKFLLKALQEFETISSSTLIVNESLVVGNDWYCWFKLSRSPEIELHTITQPLIGFDTEDSTTVRADRSKFYKLERLYDMCRLRCNIADTSSLRETVNMCYFNPDVQRPLKVLDYTGASKLAKVLPFNHLNFAGTHAREFPPQSYFGTQAFMTALEYAYCMGWQWLLYVEDDCRLAPGYDLEMQSDLANRKTSETLLYGSPIIWGARNPGPWYWKRYIEYVSEYHKLTGIPFPPEGNEQNARTAFYANGALAMYKVPFFYNMLCGAAKQGIEKVSPWDLVIGYHLYDMFRERSFDKVLASSCVHSNGGNWYMTPAYKSQFNKSIVAWHK